MSIERLHDSHRTEAPPRPRSVFRLAAQHIDTCCEEVEKHHVPHAPIAAEPAPFDHDQLNHHKRFRHNPVYTPDPVDSEPIGLALIARQNSYAQLSAQNVFARQSLHDTLRGLPPPSSHSVHDAIEEREARRRINEHGTLAGGNISEVERKRLQGVARISASTEHTKTRLQLLQLAQALDRRDQHAATLLRGVVEQRNFVDSLAQRELRRELNLRALIAKHGTVTPEALGQLELENEHDPTQMQSRISAVINRVLSNQHNVKEYQELAPHLPQLLHLYANPTTRERQFGRLRMHAENEIESPENHALLANLADTLPVLGHGHIKRRQLRALSRTRRPSLKLLQALFEQIDELPEGARDEELFHLLLAQARNEILPAYTLEQKILSLADHDWQRRAFAALSLPDA